MPEPFDPYQTWLEIPPGERPPDYYRLLGVRRFEKRAEVIEAAADARIAALRPHLSGQQAQMCAKLVADVNAARLCLANDNRRASYDIRLLQKVAAAVAEEEKGGGQTQITAAEFLFLLSQRDLVPADLLLAIRKQMSDSKAHVTARQVGKLLVDKGLLTPILVNRLLEAGARAASQPGAAPPELRGGLEPDELTLAPLEDEPKKTAAFKPRIPSANTPQPTGTRSPAEKAKRPAQPAAGGGSLLEEELKPLARGPAGGSPLDGLFADPSFQAAAGAGNPLLTTLPRRHKQRIWTSPGFLIGAGFVWILLLIGAMVLVALNRPGDEESEPSEDATVGSVHESPHQPPDKTADHNRGNRQ